MKKNLYSSAGTLAHDYPCSYDELSKQWGHNKHREKILEHAKTGLCLLKSFGIKTVFISGSFASKKDKPNDIDGVFDVSECLEYNLQDLEDFLENQDQYKLDLYFNDMRTKLTNETHEAFFRRGRDGEKRGFIVLDLTTLE